jgi:pyruvate-formate lyase-activating enzyme
VTGSSTIAITRLRELWLHTGTACNLSCPFCHEGSKPGDTRLEALTLSDVTAMLGQAAALGVERFAFTGGEPLILRDIHAILRHALQLRPVLVLTNGTAPYIRRRHQLDELRRMPHALSFRVSIDHPDEARHDAGRGLKNFRKAFEGLRLLHEAGFEIGITRQSGPGEDRQAVLNRFRNLLRRQRLPEDLPIVALPELGALDASPGDLAPLPQTTWPETACQRSRMLLRRGGQLRIAPCPLVDDDPSLDLPDELCVALAQPVEPRHRRCRICLGQGVNYVGSSPAGRV